MTSDENAGSGGLGGPGGSNVGSALAELRAWLARFVIVTNDLDLALLTLWIAHTHVVEVLYTTPRLVLDSLMPGSGKTTVLEHIYRLAHKPIQAAAISSSALLARMLSKGIRTVCIDEADRSLDPKKPGIEELMAVINSGYKSGATRPVLVPAKGNEWDVAEMSTYAPVVLAGNAPNLPDDTRSRCIRVLLMPDVDGTAEESDWELLDPKAAELRQNLETVLEAAREEIRKLRPQLPEKCIGRIKEKWSPLARVAHAAGGSWPAIVDQLIDRDLDEVAIEREEGLMKVPPGVVLLTDLHAVWPEGMTFVPTLDLVGLLIRAHPDYWGEASSYGKALTVQRMGRILVQAKVHATRIGGGDAPRGYKRVDLEPAWRQLSISNAPQPPKQTARTGPTAQTALADGKPTPLEGLLDEAQGGLDRAALREAWGKNPPARRRTA